MSSHSGGHSLVSGSSSSLKDRFKSNGFDTFRKLSSVFRKHSFLVQVAFLLEFLQLFGLVFNPFLEPFHTAVDPRFFLHRLLLPSYYAESSYWLLSNRTMSIMFASITSLLLLLVAQCMYSVMKDSPKLFILRITRVLLEVVAGPLFLPIVIHCLLYLTCSDVGRWDAVDLSQCYSPSTLLMRILFILILTFVVFIKLVYLFTHYDVSPYSRKVFSRPHSRWLFHFTLLRVILVFSMINLDHLPIVFKVLYPIIALVSLISFLFSHPFFSAKTNSKVAGMLGAWVALALIWVSKQFTDEYYPLNLNSWIISIVFIGGMTVFGVVFYFLEHYLYSRTMFKLLRLNRSLLEGNQPEIDPDQLHLPKLRSANQSELLSRFLLTLRRPTPDYIALGKKLFDSLIESFPDNVNALCLKAYFEVVYAKDALAAMVSLNGVKDLDIDVNLYWKYYVFNLYSECDVLRRLQNTGQTLDASSYVHIQRQLAETKESVQECLDHLKAFWTHLLSDRVNLQQLPLLTQKIYKTQTECDSSFRKLLLNGKGNKEILLVYVDFVRDVLNDEELLAQLLTQLDLIETESHVSSSHDGQSSRGNSFSESGSVNVSKKGSVKRERKKRKLLNFSETLTTSSSSSESSITHLFRSIIVACIVILILATVAFVSSSASLDGIEVATRQLYESDHLGYTVNSLGFQVLLNDVMSRPLDTLGSPNLNRNDIIESIKMTAEHLVLHVRRLYLGSSFLSSMPMIRSLVQESQKKLQLILCLILSYEESLFILILLL
ncbi:hypothetical protein GEMRC1_005726 [Eukaryota sp. GEM-RC1]